MDCKQIQLSLLECDAANRSPEVREHLASCQECRDFARTLDMLMEVRSAPSAALDAQVMSSCLAELSNQNALRVRRRRRLVWSSLIAGIAAVLCVLFVALRKEPLEDGAHAGQTIAADASDNLQSSEDSGIAWRLALMDIWEPYRDFEATLDYSSLVYSEPENDDLLADTSTKGIMPWTQADIVPYSLVNEATDLELMVYCAL